jgi:uncharacterized membrane protein YdjX (TVP38/TMEM64 family)
VRWLILIVGLLAFILVPFFLFEDQFNAFGEHLTRGAGGWPAAAAIAALLASDVFLPIPSSLVSTGAGLLLGFWRGCLVVWIGMTAAALLGYAFGARASAAARRFVGDRGLSRATELAERYGEFGLVMCRPVPVLAEASVIVAGLVKRPLRRFVLLTALSNLGVAAVYAAVGAWSADVQSFLLAFVAAIALPGAGMLISRLWFRSGAAG